MPKYRKKPVVIEAVQYTGTKDSFNECHNFTHGAFGIHRGSNVGVLTLEGSMEAKIGDYIIRGVNDEFYPCKPDIFVKTYERVE